MFLSPQCAKPLFVLLAVASTVWAGPFISKRLSYGDPIDWKYGGWKPILPGSRHFYGLTAARSIRDSMYALPPPKQVSFDLLNQNKVMKIQYNDEIIIINGRYLQNI